jgi:hypothetical protein
VRANRRIAGFWSSWRTAKATWSIRASPETAAFARRPNLPDRRAIAAIDPAVAYVKSNWESSRSRRAENPNSERCRFCSFIPITAASTDAYWALITAAASSRAERIATA